MTTESARLEINLPDEEYTTRLGVAIAHALEIEKQKIKEDGLVINLIGDLGAGKTFLMRSMLRALGFEGRVKSPTFSLLETYLLKDFTVNHFDFYRFEEPTEFDDAGFRESYGPGKVVASEWTSKAEPYAPAPDLLISLETNGEGRVCGIVPLSEIGKEITKLIKNEYA